MKTKVVKQTLVCLSIIMIFLIGCGKDKIVENKPDSNSDTLSLSENEEKEVKTTLPLMDDLNDELYLGGRVSFNPNYVTKVFSLANGLMTKIYANPGDHVRKGQVLGEVYSNDFANALSDFQKSSSQLENSKKALNRMKTLAESNIAAQKDFESAQRDFEQAQFEYDRALKNLKLLGGNEHSESAIFRITSPMDGIVIDRQAQPGSQVRNDGSQTLFIVGKTYDVWVILDLYQDQFDKVKVGDRVTIKFEGLKDSVFETSVNYISPNIDPTKMTAQVRCDIDNSSGELKPEMYCSATVKHKKGSGTFVPSTAVFFDGDGKNYVFLKVDNGKYLKREIQTGQKNNHQTEILKGISMTDNVVANKTIFLNEELKNNAQ